MGGAADEKDRFADPEAQVLFERAPRDVDRKRFAAWVQSQAPAAFRVAMFQMFEGAEL
jgi:hypothetical protein